MNDKEQRFVDALGKMQDTIAKIRESLNVEETHVCTKKYVGTKEYALHNAMGGKHVIVQYGENLNDHCLMTILPKNGNRVLLVWGDGDLSIIEQDVFLSTCEYETGWKVYEEMTDGR